MGKKLIMDYYTVATELKNKNWAQNQKDLAWQNKK